MEPPSLRLRELAVGGAVVLVNAFRLNPRRFIRIDAPQEPSFFDEVLFTFTVVFAVDVALLLVMLVLVKRGSLRMRFASPSPIELCIVFVALIPAFVEAILPVFSGGVPPGGLASQRLPYQVAYLTEFLVVGLFVEEVLFRSLLQGQALRRGATIQVHIFVGLLFLLSHLDFDSWAVWIPGWMFIWASVGYAVRGSLTVPILCHVLHNASWVLWDTVRLSS